MANTFKFGTNGNWAVKDGYALAYNDENNNFKPLPFDFTRASTATRVNKQGLIETVESGKPRIDFLDNTSGHLLLEPSRENKYPYSSEINSTRWALSLGGTGSNPVMNSSTEVAKDGSLTASEWVFNTGSGTSSSDQSNIYYSSISTSVGITYSFSVWVYSSLDNVEIQLRGAGTAYEKFTLSVGWNRITRIADATSTSTIPVIGLRQSVNGTVNNNITVKLWGAQFEQGSYATSYIPTEGSSVTRVAETCYQDDLRTDIIDSTYPFIIYAEAKAVFDSTQHLLTFGDRTSSARYFTLCLGSNGTVFLDARANGASENLVSSVTVSSGDFFKVAVQMESATTGKISVNGTINTKINFASQGANSSIKDLLIGMLRTVTDTGRRIPVKDARLYNTALTDTELQNLTS